MKVEQLIITGVTGLVGQHILYELLRKYLGGKFFGKIILLIRGENQEVAQSRLVNLLTHAEVPISALILYRGNWSPLKW